MEKHFKKSLDSNCFSCFILIPSIYTVVFLGSMWDPYGNSGNLPVAVVNKDKAVDYNDKKLDVGNQLLIS